MKHLCKTFKYTPLPLTSLPPPSSQETEVNLKSLISQNNRIDGSSISRTRYLHWVLTECCQILNIDEEHNYLGVKPPKFAIYEIFPVI